MAELKKKPDGPVYGNLAYDLDFLVTERALEEAGQMPQRQQPEIERRQRRQEAQRPRPQQQPAAQPKVHASPLVLGSVAVLAVMVVVLLMGCVQLSQISLHVSQMRTELDKLTTEQVELLTQYEQTFELAAGQIEYVDLGGSDTAVVYTAGSNGVLDRTVASVKNGLQALVEYFK